MSFPIVTDEEKAIVNAISEVFLNVAQLHCWGSHFKGCY